MKTRILSGLARLSVVTLIVIGLALVLGPGFTFLMVAAMVPYIVVVLVVRQEAIRQTEKCVELYLQLRE